LGRVLQQSFCEKGDLTPMNKFPIGDYIEGDEVDMVRLAKELCSHIRNDWTYEESCNIVLSVCQALYYTNIFSGEIDGRKR
jgi:hypothetical protein